MLLKLNGEMLDFNQSHLLCGQCHGPELSDWEQGIHGRTNGYWDRSRDTEGLSTRQLCVECHVPHAPAFRPQTPLPAPVSRIDNLPAGEYRPHARGSDRDLLGPHDWIDTGEEPAVENGTEDH